MTSKTNQNQAKELAKTATKETIKGFCKRLTKAEGWAAIGTKKEVIETIKNSLK